MRTRLLPHSPTLLRAMRDGPDVYERLTGVAVAPELAEFYASPDVSAEFRARMESEAEGDPWLDGFGLVLVAENRVIGSCGYKGPPNERGMVEIAYGILPAYERRGFATEAAQELVARAFGDPRVRLIRAHTVPVQNASARVLTKCGFAHRGEVTDPEDGRVWRWERRRGD